MASESKISSLKSLITHTITLFQKHFNTDPEICGCAPGRVNLLGEHVDYNEGFVLPMALPMFTVMVGRKNSKKLCNVVTSCTDIDNPKEIQIELPKDNTKIVLLPGKPAWANYVKGVIVNFPGKLCGFDALIASSVPVGGGLSSSAALEVATYTFLEGLDDESSFNLSIIEKALACQKAEHQFAGTPCGIMDQFISFAGEKDHAVILDCRSLEYDLVSLKSPGLAILITNTNVHHNLGESEYSNRKKQCETAAEILGNSLRNITRLELEDRKSQLPEVLYRRALHVVTEIDRTIDAAEALKEEKYEFFGKLMVLSHESLRDNYEVSCPELDIVVNAALEVSGVLGSRMTGGGFGGCTVTLLKTDAIENTICNIKKKYKNPTFYICRPEDGARLIKLPI